MTWKDIEEDVKRILDFDENRDYPIGRETIDSEILPLIIVRFKQAMEEMVGDKVECTKEEWAHHKNRWQQEEHNKFRQEILDKLNKFFE